MSEYISLEPPRHAYEWLDGSAFAAPFAAYAAYLAGHGYTLSVTSSYLGGAAHFLYWLNRHRHPMADIDEALVSRFLAGHLPHCHCPKRVRRGGRVAVRFALGRLLEMLRDQGWIAPTSPPSKGTLEAELIEFERHLAEVCGLSASTRIGYLRHVRRFLSTRFDAQRIDFSALSGHDVRRFIKQYSVHCQPISLRSVGVAMRSYLRFKAINGASVETLMAAIPQPAHWRLAGLPQALTQAEVERFLAAFDRTRLTGLRDYAIARCLTDLGLRAIEICRLRLEDINWGEGTLAIHGKGRRVDLLPLPKTLGRAIAQYLRRGRPASRIRTLFLPRRAPRDKPLKCAAIYMALREVARGCGLEDRLSSARLLRHTLATRLVQRGASLKTIADLLRHRSLDTTTIYAKVDLPALARVALPWPGRRV